MRELCLAGELAGWRGFIRQYGALARHLAGHYFPEQPTADLVSDVFRAAHAENAALLREFAGTSEGEFLFLFRQSVLARGRARRSAQPTSPFAPESFWALLTRFPPLQREMILLTFRGHAPEEINRIHRFELESAQKILAQVVERARAELGPAFREDFLRANHDGLFAAIEGQRTDKCVPDKTCVRIVDGQLTWREKENVDYHIDDCLYCLARFAEYREVFYYYSKLPPLEATTLNDIATAVGLPPEKAAKPRGFTRLIPRIGRR